MGADTRRRQRCLAWLLLVVLTVFLHLWVLGERSYHHDEAIHAKLSYDLASGGSYRYDPTYHGPLLYYLTAAVFLVHDSDFTARLPIAAAGIGMLWVAWRLRRFVGERAAWWTGLLFTVSPMFLYYGRFLRMDLLEVLTASLALLAFADVLRRLRLGKPATAAWVAVGLWSGLAFATKENAYVTAALLGATGGVMMVYHGLAATVPRVLAWLRANVLGLALAVVVFLTVTIPLYTVGFSRLGDWAFPVRAISYWWNQHDVQRVGGPWWFHLPRLVQYEFLVLAASAAWVVRRAPRLRPLEQVLALLGLMSIAMYCYLGEKVPWLGVHQVWPLIPLAGAQLARAFRGRRWSRGLAATGLCATALVSLSANFMLEEITPRQRRVESLHFVQTCPEVKEVVREALASAGADRFVAAVSGEAAWPLTWYLRDQAVFWSTPTAGVRPPVVVCDPGDEAQIMQALGAGYARERIPLRAWWLMYQWSPELAGLRSVLAGEAGLTASRPWAVVRYCLTRLPWSVVGSTDVVVLRRTGVLTSAPREVEVPAALSVLGVVSARVIGEGWLAEPRGLAMDHGRVVVADVGLNRVVEMAADGGPPEVVMRLLAQPEAAARLANGDLVVADTWNHRVIRVASADGATSELPAPDGGWYGPRSVAVGGAGIAVSDTGNKRVVVYDHRLESPVVIDGAAAGGLDEPVGLAWLDGDSLLVCDTGHRRLLILDQTGAVDAEIGLRGAWTDYYSRPQAATLEPGTFVVSDTPGRALWLVRAGEVSRLALDREGISPTGVAFDAESRTLAVGDLRGSVWVFALGEEEGGAP